MAFVDKNGTQFNIRKSKGKESILDVVNNAEKKSTTKKDTFDREPMRLCATGSAIAGIGLSIMAVHYGADYLIAAIIATVGFYFTMVAKGTRKSTYCMVLAFANLFVGVGMVIAKLKSIGAFDWLEFSIK